MKENIVLDKSCQFALRIVRLSRYLNQEKSEFILSKQVLLSGTFIGAHIKAAQEAESRAGFIRDMHLALQDTSRTGYWLRLLNDAGLIDQSSYESIFGDCNEIFSLLTAILKSTKGQ